MSGEKYYYKCGTHIDTNMVGCTRGTAGFKDFKHPNEYKNVKLIGPVDKKTMDKKYYHLHPSTPILNMFWIMAVIGTVGEYQFLGDELSTRNVWIVD